MAVNIKFDLVGNPEPPTIILATRNGNKLGQLNVNEDSIELSDKLNDASEFTFTLNKYINGDIANLWEDITNFKLVYCKEWDMWFEITVELDEETETVKTVFCTQLGQAELSQLKVYNIEINTEKDIERDDYKISILWDAFEPEVSIIHRILNDKAPHYSVIHVDPTIAKIQRTFSFDDVSIYDAFQEISEEIGCLFVFHSNSGEDGSIQRTISIYDLESNCNNCGHRGEFTRVCPECESQSITEGYGDDTTIFITADELAENIQLTTDTDNVKNCFKLEAGDDLMTATIRNCNPNGTDYLWHISDASKIDMSKELVEKLEDYNEDYKKYQKEYVSDLDSDTLRRYNTLVKKYQVYNEDLEEIKTPIVGYPSLMQAYYNTVDLELYLESSLMPAINMDDTDANKEARRLISGNLSPVSVESIEYISKATADNVVLAMAKIIVDSKYKVEISESSFDEGTKLWSGRFKVTNYSDEEDNAISSIANVFINDDYSSFVQQKIEKMLNKEDTDDYSISGLFENELGEFKTELKKYSLNCLKSFHNACQSCIDILIEQGIGTKSTWSGQETNLYDDLYVLYLDKLSAIENEMKIRQEEVDLIVGVYSLNGELKTYGLQNYIEEIQDFIHNQLDFEKYLGNNLWLEFCSFRREDKYSNSNYVSDGLNNIELFDNALKFIDVAQKEIYKSSELQHSIKSSLKNLLAIKKFAPLVNNFKVGNWLRILVDDVLYKLRLIEYDISYNDFDNISVEFSDVVKIDSSVKSIKGVIEQANKMATSYDTVQKQAEAGKKSNEIIGGWSLKGLDVTNTRLIQGATDQTQIWDEHGMLFRKYDEVTDTYDDTQLKIVNSTMAITDDNWKTVKTAVGEYYYFDPVTNELKKAYGINGEVLVGKLILGEQLGIYNESGTMTFDDNGFKITNGTNSFEVTPNEDVLFCISNEDEDILYVDDKGKLYIRGDGSGLDISGTVVISGLGDGSTVINGGCIQTGTIDASKATITNINASNITTGELNADLITTGTMSADRVNMTGAISWTDLDTTLSDDISSIDYAATWASNAVQAIANGNSNYIKGTFIDGNIIKSPIIQGNEIQVYGTFQTIGLKNGMYTPTGYMGAAMGSESNNGVENKTYGVALSYAWNPTTQEVSDSYVIVTDAGVRLQHGNNKVVVSDGGVYLTTTGAAKAFYNGKEIGSSSGTAVFG